jgi:hypothetical protein
MNKALDLVDRAHLMLTRPPCPHCGSEQVHPIIRAFDAEKGVLWKCRQCKARFEEE